MTAPWPTEVVVIEVPTYVSEMLLTLPFAVEGSVRAESRRDLVEDIPGAVRLEPQVQNEILMAWSVRYSPASSSAAAAAPGGGEPCSVVESSPSPSATEQVPDELWTALPEVRDLLAAARLVLAAADDEDLNGPVLVDAARWRRVRVEPIDDLRSAVRAVDAAVSS